VQKNQLGLAEKIVKDLKAKVQLLKQKIAPHMLDIKTRNERVLSVSNSKFVEKYHNDKAKQFIEFILDRYRKDGVQELDEDKLSDLIKLSGIERNTLKQSFRNYNIRDEYFKLQREIYR